MNGRADRRRRLSVVAALAAAAVGLGACGIPVSQSAQPASSRDLNPQLSQLGPPTTTTPKPPPSVATPHSNHLEIFLVNRGASHLVPVQRSWASHVTPSIALSVLALGPNAVDTRLGLQTDLATGAAPKDVPVNRAGVAKVVLDESTFVPLVGASLYVPLAQITFTLMTNFSYIKGVDFYLGTNPPQLFNYTPDGSNQLSPVTEQTYAALKPVAPAKRSTSKS